MTRQGWSMLVVAGLLAAPATAQEGGPGRSDPHDRPDTLLPLEPAASSPPTGPGLWQTWRLRITGRMGGGYLSYEESLPGVKSDFGSGAFVVRAAVEANIAGFSPSMKLATELTWGEETARVMASRQTDDLSLVTLLMDVGAGYRLDLSETVSLVPGVAYTLDVLAFERDGFEVNGSRVTLTDLDGKPLDSVGEGILGHGLSGSLGLELRPAAGLEVRLHGVFTWLPLVSVDNDIGGELDTQGYSVRGGLAAYFWITPQLGVGGEIEFLLRLLEKSDVELASGSLATATVQYPDSETFATALTVGVTTRF